MYRLIVADDEEITQDALKLIINKGFDNIEIVGNAATGREAVEFACELTPDIMIMDIRLPGINGLEAISEIKQRYPGIRFIIISAYDEFDYASDAIRLGIDEYILKPFKRDDVIGALRKEIDILEENKNKIRNVLELKERLNSLIPLLENEFVYSLIFGDIEKIKNVDYPSLLDHKFEAGFCMVFSLNGSNYPDNIQNPLGKSYLNQKIVDIVRKNLTKQYSCIVSPIIAGRIIVFFFMDGDAGSNYATRLWSIDVARDICRRVKNNTDIDVKVGIGECYDDISYLTVSYHEALNALNYSREIGKVIHYGDVQGSIPLPSVYPDHIENYICEKVKLGDCEGALEAFREFFDIVTNGSGNNAIRLCSRISKLFLALSSVIYDRDDSDKSNWWFSDTDIENLFTMSSKGEIFQWCLNKLSLITSNVLSVRNDHIKSIVAKAIEYIEQNYNKEINLAAVARKVAVSPYYLSKLFKLEKDRNFIDYITDIRISAAKKLLSEDLHTSIKEICFQVGYNDPKYFTKVFKKMSGFTPYEYRENIMQSR